MLIRGGAPNTAPGGAEESIMGTTEITPLQAAEARAEQAERRAELARAEANVALDSATAHCERYIKSLEARLETRRADDLDDVAYRRDKVARTEQREDDNAAQARQVLMGALPMLLELLANKFPEPAAPPQGSPPGPIPPG